MRKTYIKGQGAEEKNYFCKRKMQLKTLLSIIETYLPPGSAMEGDRLGLQVQSINSNPRKILITLELNEELIEDAISRDINCIITFHPLIYNPLIKIDLEDRVGSLLSKLIKHDISLISVHTTFDAYADGTSKIFAEKLGLVVERLLDPNPEYPGFGFGVVARDQAGITETELLRRVFETCHSPIKYCHGIPSGVIKRIGIVGGSGGSFLRENLLDGLDAFITADLTYHTFHKYKGKLLLIDPGHYEMEQFVPMGLHKFLKSKLDPGDYDLLITSSIHTNPVQYYPGGEKYTDMQKKYLLVNKSMV